MSEHARKANRKSNPGGRQPDRASDPDDVRRSEVVDPDLTAKLHAALSPFDVVGLRAEVRHGLAYLRGLVASHAIREQIEFAALEIPGVTGLVSGLTVEPDTAGEALFASDLEPMIGGFDDVTGIPTPISGTEPDFNAMIGSTDSAVAADGDDVFYPPTDPVVRPISRNAGDLEVVGGFAAGSLDSPIEAEDRPTHYVRGDEEIEEEVVLALGEDSATIDLDLKVHVRNGVVFLRGRVNSLEDADLAEEIAGRVDGVREVREELEVAGIER